MRLDWADLPALFPACVDPERWLPLLELHSRLVSLAAPRVSVTAVAEEDAVRRHYAESLELLRLIETRCRPARLADVGSGGGYPGMVVAAVRPGLDVHLIEPLKKRAALLAELRDALGLTNVTVHPLRAEEAGRGPLRESADAVTARAVAETRELLEYTSPLAAVGGVIALPKGSAITRELAAAETAAGSLGVRLDEVIAMREEVSTALSVAFYRKECMLDSRYPRRSGLPGKRPL